MYMIKFDRLISGGLITNYYCSSSCKHCVYCSSPSWPKDYMERHMAEEIFRFLKNMGCSSIHIGGGEPFLEYDKLLDILDAAAKINMHIEYIETNASWHININNTLKILEEAKKRGVRTLLISIDPFHNEFIPFKKVKELFSACRTCGMEVFPWLMDFWNDIDHLDDTKTHSFEEYEEAFGAQYRKDVLKRYGVNMKGRALKTFKPYLKKITLKDILEASKPCSEIRGVYHFHVDLYGNFVPQSCPGLSIYFKDVAKGADKEKYNIISLLYEHGIKALYEFAVEQHGFVPEQTYTGKCDLCISIRRFFVLQKGLDLCDLKPEGHYIFV